MQEEIELLRSLHHPNIVILWWLGISWFLQKNFDRTHPPPRDASHGDSCETLNSTVVQTRSFAWGRTPHERNHEDQPIVTEAVRSTCPR